MRLIAHFFYAKKQTNRMVHAAIIVALVLFLPIFVSAYLAFDARYKKLYFSVFLFGKIKALSGYFKPKFSGGYLHAGDKAYFIKYSSVFKMKQSPLTLSAFTVTDFKTNIFISKTKFGFVYALTAGNILSSIVSSVICKKRRYLTVKNNLYVFDGEFENFAFNANVNFTFCIIGLIINVLKNLIKKGVKSAKKRKQNCGSY